MKFVSKSLFAAVAVAVAALSTSAQAGTATANFQVTATVSSTCVVSATNVAFGTVNPAATGTASATGTISSTCTKSTPYTLNINAGSGTFASRTMTGATSGNTDKLAYNLYTANTYATVFGDGTGSTGNVSLTGTGAAQTTTVYGQLSLNQYITPDSYADNLTVTLSY
jgi:spore coat protein U-like protein